MILGKPRIRAFRWQPLFLSIDWEAMAADMDPNENAFILIVKDASAQLFNRPPDRSPTGIHGAISPFKIIQFVTRPDPESGLNEVVLEVIYGTGERSLGLTDHVEEAALWIADANRVVLEARDKRASNRQP